MADSSLSIAANAGSAIEARATQVSRNLRAPGTADGDSVTKSAKEFEAVLLGHWLEDAEKAFATVPGSDPDKDSDPGAGNYRSIGLQGVATSIANRGGIGIASMLVKYLHRTADPVASPIATPDASIETGPGKGATGRD